MPKKISTPNDAEADLDQLTTERSDLNGEVTVLLEDHKFDEALAKMDGIVALDCQIDGGITNDNLLRFADIYAVKGDWWAAKESILQLQSQVEAKISGLESTENLDYEERMAQKMSLDSLRRLQEEIILNRLRMYEDFGERVRGLRSLVRGNIERTGNDDFRDVIRGLRFNLAINTFPVFLCSSLIQCIADLSKSIGIDPDKCKAELFRIADVVFSYATVYFDKIDPDNQRYLVDICLECPDEPGFEGSRVAKTYNQIASEERILNRARRILSNNLDLIEANGRSFLYIEEIIDSYVSKGDEVVRDGLPAVIARYLVEEEIDLLFDVDFCIENRELADELCALSAGSAWSLTTQQVFDLSDQVFDGKFEGASFDQHVEVALLLAQVTEMNLEDFDDELRLEAVVKLARLVFGKETEVNEEKYKKIKSVLRVLFITAGGIKSREIQGIDIERQILLPIRAQMVLFQHLESPETMKN